MYLDLLLPIIPRLMNSPGQKSKEEIGINSSGLKVNSSCLCSEAGISPKEMS